MPLKGKRLTVLFNKNAAIRDGDLAKDLGDHTEGNSAFGFAIVDRGDDVCPVSMPVPSCQFQANKKAPVAAIKIAWTWR